MSNDDIIDTLNDLIETSKDGEYGFRTSAEYLNDRRAEAQLHAGVPRSAARPLPNCSNWW